MQQHIDKKYVFLEALIKFSEIFGSENIGEYELDLTKIMEFADSEYFILRMSWDCETLDDYYKLIENMVLDGFPIWNFFRISDWTKNMLVREFQEQVKEELKAEEEEKKKYKCYTCEYFEEIKTPLGTIEKCNKPREENGFRRFRMLTERESIFEPKKECNYYKERREE